MYVQGWTKDLVLISVAVKIVSKEHFHLQDTNIPHEESTSSENASTTHNIQWEPKIKERIHLLEFDVQPSVSSSIYIYIYTYHVDITRCLGIIK